MENHYELPLRHPADAPVRNWLPNKDRDHKKITPFLNDTIRDVVTGHQPWPLVMVGEAGCGKSCAGLLITDHYGGLYTTVGDWCKRVADAMHGNLLSTNGYKISEAEVWREWERAPVCVLDELGTREKVSDHHFETVKKCIDSRVDERKPLVCISNLSLAMLQVSYDDRISSRLNAGTVVALEGDRRGN